MGAAGADGPPSLPNRDHQPRGTHTGGGGQAPIGVNLSDTRAWSGLGTSPRPPEVGAASGGADIPLTPPRAADGPASDPPRRKFTPMGQAPALRAYAVRPKSVHLLRGGRGVAAPHVPHPW